MKEKDKDDNSIVSQVIKKVPQLRRTKAQIIATYPDLEGVELVGGWE